MSELPSFSAGDTSSERFAARTRGEMRADRCETKEGCCRLRKLIVQATGIYLLRVVSKRRTRVVRILSDVPCAAATTDLSTCLESGGGCV